MENEIRIKRCNLKLAKSNQDIFSTWITKVMGRKFKTKRAGKHKIKSAKTKVNKDKTKALAARQKYFEYYMMAILLAFGAYHSLLYFGHQLVPNPDFTDFVKVGHQLLSFQIPTSFKRAPVLGILQVALSKIVGGRYPDLTAGWLLNAILHPFNILLLYLVSKRIIGKAAIFVALMAMLNPYVIRMLVDPIVETTLLFFVLLTFFFMFKRSKWVYLFASITTMVRYEGAALILAAFVMDMIYEKGTRRHTVAFLYSLLASLPLILWMLGTALNFGNEDETHYLKELGAGGEFGRTFIIYIKTIWKTGISPLFFPIPNAKNMMGVMMDLCKFFTAASFVFGSVYGLIKRQWQILALLLFLVLYVLVHTAHSFVLARCCMIIHWIVIVLCVYGIQGSWRLFTARVKIPNRVLPCLHAAVALLAILWLVKLIPFLDRAAGYSSRSVSIPYVAIGVVVLIFILQRTLYRSNRLISDLTASILVCMMIVSNQLMLSFAAGNGQHDMEFKLLADWYISNAQEGKKLVTTMPNLMGIFAPEDNDNFIHIHSIHADNPIQFVKQCHENKVEYVVWDSRLGMFPENRFYKLWHLENIASLAKPGDTGPYKFVTQIRVNKEQFVNIFRLS